VIHHWREIFTPGDALLFVMRSQKRPWRKRPGLHACDSFLMNKRNYLYYNCIPNVKVFMLVQAWQRLMNEAVTGMTGPPPYPST
jgi:hypothetical protein